MAGRRIYKTVIRIGSRPVFALCLALLINTACDETSPVGPVVPFDRQFVLAAGEMASIEGTIARVQFESVTSDSRCPIDALCIQAGEAVLTIRVFDDQGSSGYELHTGDPRQKAATHRSLIIEVVELQPYPASSRPTNPSEYRATLKVTRTA